jgi:hypothetical protein
MPDGKFFLPNGKITQKSQSCMVKLNNEKSPHEFGSGSDAVDDEQVRHHVGFRFVQAKSKNAIQNAEIQLPKVSNRESPRCASVLRAAPSRALLPTGFCVSGT